MAENYFLAYNEITGEFKGWYLKEIHGDNIPEPNIEVTKEIHDSFGCDLVYVDTSTKEIKMVDQVEMQKYAKPIFNNGVWSEGAPEEEVAKKKQEDTNKQSLDFLDDTDWKVTRHQDQLANGGTPSLTDEEFKDLLVKRQQARDSIIH